MSAAEKHAGVPYAQAALAYVDLGYSPVPVEGKHPPLKGYTGWRGRYVDALDAKRLAKTHGAWNVGLRLHDDVVGVDVDAYAGGLDTLASLEAELGPLPPTVMSTARVDGSGIRLYRRPVGWHLAGQVGTGIQIVQASHRYVMSASSIHPTLGLAYRWLDAETGDEVDLIRPDELPDLPWAWLERFRALKAAGADPVDADSARAFIAAHIDATFPAALKGIEKRLTDVTVGGRHDALIEMACWAMREAAAGLYTAEDAVTMLSTWWDRAVQEDPARREGPEFGSAICWAIAQAEADPERVQEIRGSGITIDGPTDADDLGVAPDGHRLTDVGNSARLIAMGDGKLRYVHAWGKWLVYKRGRWIIDENNALITEHAKKVAKAMLRMAIGVSDKEERQKVWAWAVRSESSGSIAAMIHLARGVDGILTEHEDLDADPYLLNVRNGTIDLRTGDLHPHDPGDLLTLQCPVAYNPDATARLWESCVETWQPNPDVRRYIQVRAGASATGRPTETVDVDYGGGGNGKSKCHGAIQHVLGDYAVVPHKSLLVAQRHEQHATVVAKLFRKRCAIASETKAADALDDEQVKNLTGGDRLSGRRMREDPWEFNPTHTLIMFSNHKPKVQGRDEGIWRRLRLVPWDVTITAEEKDEDLADKLQAEAPGILRWIVDGARIFLADGLHVPDVVRAATDQYRTDEDVVGRFAAEVLRFGGGWCTTANLKAELDSWCQDLGVEPVTINELAEVLRRAGCTPKRRTLHGVKTSMWSGVTIVEVVPGPDEIAGQP